MLNRRKHGQGANVFKILDKLFVCLGFIVPLAHMAIEQLRFLSVPNLLWHGTSIFNGHLREPVTLTPIAERLAVELSLPVL